MLGINMILKWKRDYKSMDNDTHSAVDFGTQINCDQCNQGRIQHEIYGSGVEDLGHLC